MLRRALAPVAATLALGTFLVMGTAAGPAKAADYSDADYRAHDLDNVSRSGGDQARMATDPAYGMAFFGTAAETWLANQGDQVADLPRGRVHVALAQLLPGGAVGDPEALHEVPMRTIQFLSRTGAKLDGRIFGSEGAGPRPAVLITTGSIQGHQQMYWWAARTLAKAGYVVMTWDVQGQGESETFGHAAGDPAPTGDGVPFQQAANFVDGTVDALRFFLSTPTKPYVPGTWTAAQVAASKAATKADEQIDWLNPGWAAIDGKDNAGRDERISLGLAGHSLGAGAVSQVQQCSSAATLWQTTEAELCTGRSFPIKAVIGWDSLSGGVVPVVPGMSQSGDGYFMNPTPAQTSPDPAGHLGAYDDWTAAGVDSFSFSVRGGTHLEWADVPYILPRTTYGNAMADYYTLAWFDRYVNRSSAVRKDALARLLTGPIPTPTELQGTVNPWRANLMSARYLSAFTIRNGKRAYTAPDLRAYAGLSPVGDWAGANADTQGRFLP